MLDYRLPDSNDLALLSRIRQLSPRSAVLMMTAFGTPEVIEQALALGVSRVIEKPFEMHDLEAMVVEACAARSPLELPTRLDAPLASGSLRRCAR